MKFRLFVCIMMAVSLLLSTHAIYAAGSDNEGYKEQWILNEKQLGLSFEYQYSFSRTSVGVFSVPTINKAGNTYVVAHDRNDVTASTILCLDKGGKVKWRKDFKANELDVTGNYIHTDQEGNIYYLSKRINGKTRDYIVHSLTPDGIERWAYLVLEKEMPGIAISGDGNTILETNNKLYVLNPLGKVVATKDLPKTNANNLSFLSAEKGKLLFSQSLFNKDTYIGNEIYIYGSDNKLQCKIPASIGFGSLKSKFVRFFDNGDFLYVQSYDDSKKLPAVLRLYDPKGRQKWSKVFYNKIDPDGVFISDRNVYYVTDSLNPGAAKGPVTLHLINADNGVETHTFSTDQQAFPVLYTGYIPVFYTGYNQEVVKGHESIIKTKNQDLSAEKDSAIYVIGKGEFKKLHPRTLAILADYQSSLEAYMLDTYQADIYHYEVVSARNGFAYVYVQDPTTRQYSYIKLKLPKL